MTRAAEPIETKLTTVQFWILYLLAWCHYKALLKEGVQDDVWHEILLCLQAAYDDSKLHKLIAYGQ